MAPPKIDNLVHRRRSPPRSWPFPQQRHRSSVTHQNILRHNYRGRTTHQTHCRRDKNTVPTIYAKQRDLSDLPPSHHYRLCLHHRHTHRRTRHVIITKKLPTTSHHHCQMIPSPQLCHHRDLWFRQQLMNSMQRYYKSAVERDGGTQNDVFLWIVKDVGDKVGCYMTVNIGFCYGGLGLSLITTMNKDEEDDDDYD